VVESIWKRFIARQKVVDPKDENSADSNVSKTNAGHDLCRCVLQANPRKAASSSLAVRALSGEKLASSGVPKYAY
jgi:hypothetical protein